MVFGKYINKYYLKYGFILFIGILALIAVDVYQLKIPEIYGRIVDGLDPTTQTTLTIDLLKKLCLDMLEIVFVLVIGRFLWRICFFGSAIKVEGDIRNKMFNHCKDLSQNFYQKNKVGNLMSLFTNDLDTINECFGDGVLMFFDAFGLGSMAIYKMAKLSLTLTILSLIPMIFMGIVSFIVGKFMMKKWELRQEAFSQLSDFAQESFSGISVIRSFVKEAKELAAFNKINKNNENRNVVFTKYSTLLRIFTSLFIESVICVILGVGGYYVYKNEFNSSELICFLSYFNSVIWPIMAISNLIEMSSRGRASLKRISELLDSPKDVLDKPDVLLDLKPFNGNIRFNHLTFKSMDSDYAILEDVTFEIKSGENVGIIGRTGSGKTTLVDLILRIYNVEDGTIFIDGMDINQIPIKTLRKNISYVPQDNFLFSDTIENNIAFSLEEEVSHEKVVEVAKLADLDHNISSFKEGYQTVLGERGVTISGGQKQRTSIARALIKNAPILILDDAVSAVDTKTEKTIIHNLKLTREGKTTILIAHRISTIQHMDKVLFIDDGKILAFGTHDELYQNCKEYHKMVELQRLEDEAGGE